MGTWHLEVLRMTLYIAFPVGLFHWFNQPENFTQFVEKVREETGMGENPELRKQFNEFVENQNRIRDLERLRAMESKYVK